MLSLTLTQCSLVVSVTDLVLNTTFDRRYTGMISLPLYIRYSLLPTCQPIRRDRGDKLRDFHLFVY